MNGTESRTARLENALGRSRVYSFLASVFVREPDDNVIKTLTYPAVRLGLLGGIPDLPVEVAGGEDLEAVRQDHHDLFRVPGGKYVTPFESVYLGGVSAEGEETLGPLGGPVSAAVERFYRECGLQIDFVRFRELPDHVGTALAFLERLCDEEYKAINNGDDDLAEGCRRTERLFLERHLSLWVGKLCERIREKAETKFYLAIAHIFENFVSEELQTLSREESDR